MKHEMRPTYQVEAEADITAFSDEYDLGKYAPFLARNNLLTLISAHEGNKPIYVLLEFDTPYHNIQTLQFLQMFNVH